MKRLVELDENLVSFCDTDRQKEIIEAVIKHGSTKDAATFLQTPQRWVQQTVKNIKRKAAIKGYAPKNDMTRICPDPFVVKGTSTLYDKEGKVSAQWVKTTLDETKLAEYIEGVVEASLGEIKPVKVGKCISKCEKDILTVYPIADLHIGMLSWSPETGTDYDLEITEKVLKKVLTKLIERAPTSESCLLSNLGDWLHVDSIFNETLRSGNKLDVDSRYSKIYAVAMRLLRYCIETLAAKHKHVYVVNCMGNHDDMGAITLNVALENIYSRSKRIHIISTPAPRQYFRFGNTLIGSTHGYDCTAKDLPIVMATERSKDWGETKNHVWLTGHLHQDKVVEVGDCKVETFRTLAGKDAWTNAKGYLSGRDLKAIVFHKEFGEIERYTVSSDPDLYKDCRN